MSTNNAAALLALSRQQKFTPTGQFLNVDKIPRAQLIARERRLCTKCVPSKKIEQEHSCAPGEEWRTTKNVTPGPTNKEHIFSMKVVISGRFALRPQTKNAVNIRTGFQQDLSRPLQGI